MKNFGALQVLVTGLSFLSILMLLRMHRGIERTPRALSNVDVKEEPAACKVLVSNYKVNFHTEILESILALFPVELLPLSNECDRSNIVFDFILRYSSQGMSWEKYFNDEMVNKNYNANGETRTASSVKLVSKTYSDQVKTEYDATVEASCYCTDEYKAMMKREKDTICVFHERCDDMEDNPRAFWLSPHHERYIFPSVLPTPSTSRRATLTAKLPLSLCVIGSGGRRNFGFLVDFLKSLPEGEAMKLIKINLFGKGEFPDALKDYDEITTHESIKDFVEFQHTVASNCDVLLPLLDTKNTRDYFDKSSSHKKLTGSIVQAVAYGIPMVVHKDLAKLYRLQHDRAVVWETHTDESKTFVTALTNLVEQMGNITLTTEVIEEDQKVLATNE